MITFLAFLAFLAGVIVALYIDRVRRRIRSMDYMEIQRAERLMKSNAVRPPWSRVSTRPTDGSDLIDWDAPDVRLAQFGQSAVRDCYGIDDNEGGGNNAA